MVVDRESGKKRNIFYRIFSVVPRRMKTNLLACLVFRNGKKTTQNFKKEKHNLSYFILFYCCLAFVIVELQFFSISAVVTA